MSYRPHFQNILVKAPKGPMSGGDRVIRIGFAMSNGGFGEGPRLFPVQNRIAAAD
jgi:hypothetical protein